MLSKTLVTTFKTLLTSSSQHYQKIRKESRNNATTNSIASFSTPIKATASAKSTPTSKRKNTKSFSNSSSYSNEDDEEDLEATPSAKRKRSVKKEKPEPQDMGGFAGQTAAQFKVEIDGGDNGDSYRSPIDLVDEGYNTPLSLAQYQLTCVIASTLFKFH